MTLAIPCASPRVFLPRWNLVLPAEAALGGSALTHCFGRASKIAMTRLSSGCFSRTRQGGGSRDGTTVLVVNQLPPYPSFDEWAPVVERMVGHYAEIARPTSATEVGVRYFNRVSFAEPEGTT